MTTRATMFLLIGLLIIPGAIAEEAASPGVTPDSWLWGVDKTFDNIRLSLTFNDVKKAEKALAIAEERLEEIRVMIEEDKLSSSEKARDEHKRLLLKVESELDDIQEDDPLEELEVEVELEERISRHRDRVLDLEVEGELTDEQQAAVDALIATLDKNVDSLEIKIRKKQDEVKTRIREEVEDPQPKIDTIEHHRWEWMAEQRIAQAERNIAKTEEKIERFEEKHGVPSTDQRPSWEVPRDATEGDIPVTGNVIDEPATAMVRDTVTSDSPDEEHEDDNILHEYGLFVPDIDERGVHVSRMLLEDARAALTDAKHLFESEEFRNSYAYATFAKKLATEASKGKYLSYKQDAYETTIPPTIGGAYDEEDETDDYDRDSDNMDEDKKRGKSSGKGNSDKHSSIDANGDDIEEELEDVDWGDEDELEDDE